MSWDSSNGFYVQWECVHCINRRRVWTPCSATKLSFISVHFDLQVKIKIKSFVWHQIKHLLGCLLFQLIRRKSDLFSFYDRCHNKLSMNWNTILKPHMCHSNCIFRWRNSEFSTDSFIETKNMQSTFYIETIHIVYLWMDRIVSCAMNRCINCSHFVSIPSKTACELSQNNHMKPILRILFLEWTNKNSSFLLYEPFQPYIQQHNAQWIFGFVFVFCSTGLLTYIRRVNEMLFRASCRIYIFF